MKHDIGKQYSEFHHTTYLILYLTDENGIANDRAIAWSVRHPVCFKSYVSRYNYKWIQ